MGYIIDHVLLQLLLLHELQLVGLAALLHRLCQHLRGEHILGAQAQRLQRQRGRRPRSVC